MCLYGKVALKAVAGMCSRRVGTTYYFPMHSLPNILQTFFSIVLVLYEILTNFARTQFSITLD